VKFNFFLQIKIVRIIYEWGKVKKVLSNKTGITIYSWTVWQFRAIGRSEIWFDRWKLRVQNRPIISNSCNLNQNYYWLWVYFGLSVSKFQNMKNDTSLFSFRNIKILTNIDKYAIFFFFNFGADSLNCGSILDNIEINPEVCTTVLYYTVPQN
jgi:hypothetical protein